MLEQAPDAYPDEAVVNLLAQPDVQTGVAGATEAAANQVLASVAMNQARQDYDEKITTLANKS